MLDKASGEPRIGRSTRRGYRAIGLDRSHLEVTDEDDLKLILPQELKATVELHGEFEFIGFFERESTRPLQSASPDNIVLLRKK